MWVFLSVTGAGLLLALPSLIYGSRKPADDNEIEVDTLSNEKTPSKKG